MTCNTRFVWPELPQSREEPRLLDAIEYGGLGSAAWPPPWDRDGGWARVRAPAFASRVGGAAADADLAAAARAQPVKVGPRTRAWAPPAFDVPRVEAFDGCKRSLLAEWPDAAAVPRAILDPLLSAEIDAAAAPRTLPSGTRLATCLVSGSETAVYAGGAAWSDLFLHSAVARRRVRFAQAIRQIAVAPGTDAETRIACRHPSGVSVSLADASRFATVRVLQPLGNEAIASVAWSPFESERLAFVGESGSAGVLRLTGETPVDAWRAETPEMSWTHVEWGAGPFEVFAASPSGGVWRWDVRSGARDARPLVAATLDGAGGPVEALTALPSSLRFATASPTALCLWDARATQRPLLRLAHAVAALPAPVAGLEFPREGNLLLAWTRSPPALRMCALDLGKDRLPPSCAARPVRLVPFAAHASVRSVTARHPDPCAHLARPRAYTRMAAAFRASGYVAPPTCPLAGVAVSPSGETLWQLDGEGAVYVQRLVRDASLFETPKNLRRLERAALDSGSKSAVAEGPAVLVRAETPLKNTLAASSYRSVAELLAWVAPPPAHSPTAAPAPAVFSAEASRAPQTLFELARDSIRPLVVRRDKFLVRTPLPVADEATAKAHDAWLKRLKRPPFRALEPPTKPDGGPEAAHAVRIPSAPAASNLDNCKFPGHPEWSALGEQPAIVSSLARWAATDEPSTPSTQHTFPVSATARELVRRLEAGLYTDLDARIVQEAPAGARVRRYRPTPASTAAAGGLSGSQGDPADEARADETAYLDDMLAEVSPVAIAESPGPPEESLLVGQLFQSQPAPRAPPEEQLLVGQLFQSQPAHADRPARRPALSQPAPRAQRRRMGF